MSAKFHVVDCDEGPPLVEAFPLHSGEPLQVTVDEELSGPTEDDDMVFEYHIPEANVRIVPLEFEIQEMPSVQHRRRYPRQYFFTGSILLFLGLSFFTVAAVFFARPSNLSTSALRALCANPSTNLWTPTYHIDTGNLRLVAMNSNLVVGLQGQTMLETRDIVSNSLLDVQYIEGIESLALSDDNVLVVSIKDDVPQMMIHEDSRPQFEDDETGNYWVVKRSIGKPARLLDSNGEQLVLWTGKDIYYFGGENLHHIDTILDFDVQALKLSLDGAHIFAATDDGEVRVFEHVGDVWHARQSIQYNNSDEDSGASDSSQRKINEDTSVVDLSVSLDGRMVSIRTSKGQLLLYSYFERGFWQEVGGEDRMDVSLAAISPSGRRIAIATLSQEILVFEKREGPGKSVHVNLIMESLFLGNETRLLQFQDDDRLQVMMNGTMMVFENKCSVSSR